jgi:hypothetical protein
MMLLMREAPPTPRYVGGHVRRYPFKKISRVRQSGVSGYLFAWRLPLKSDELERQFYEALVGEYGPVPLTGALQAVAPLIFEARAKSRKAKVRWSRLAEILSLALRKRGLAAITADTLRGMAHRLKPEARIPDQIPKISNLAQLVGIQPPLVGVPAAKIDRLEEMNRAVPRFAMENTTEDTGDRIARMMDELTEVEKSRRANAKR